MNSVAWDSTELSPVGEAKRKKLSDGYQVLFVRTYGKKADCLTVYSIKSKMNQVYQGYDEEEALRAVRSLISRHSHKRRTSDGSDGL